MPNPRTSPMLLTLKFNQKDNIMNSIRKNTIAILIFAALFTNSLVAETGIDHGNSGDDEGIIAYKGVKKSTFQAGKRNLPLRKLKRKFSLALLIEF